MVKKAFAMNKKTKQKKASHKITKDMTMADVVTQYPKVAETLMSLGLHCIGCHASAFETLETGLKVHGMSDEEVKEVLEKLNKIVDRHAKQQKT